MTDNNDVIRKLAHAGIPFELLHHENVFTMDDVMMRLSIPVHAQAKTLVLEVLDESRRMVLCGLSAAGALDLKKVASHLGLPRSRLQFLAPEKIFEKLGAPRGAIGLAHATGITPVLLSSKLARSEFIYFGAGRHDMTIKMRTSLAMEKLGITTVDIER